MAGTDDLGVHLFETDPSGALIAYKATCIGIGRVAAVEVLEKEYQDDMEFEDALKLGLKALGAAIEEKPKAECVEIGVAAAGKRFYRLPEETISELISQLPDVES